MKKLCEKILTILISIFVVSSLLLSAVLYSAIYYMEIHTEELAARDAVDQLVDVILQLEEANQKAKELFVEDYLNRMSFISYLVEDCLEADLAISDAQWAEILERAEVPAVYVVNGQGIIVQSSDKESLGLDFYAHSETADFLPLIEGREQAGYHVNFDAVEVTTGEPAVYLGKALDSGDVLQIKVEMEVLERYQNMTNVVSYIRNIPTRLSRILFAVDAQTGEVIGVSRTNVQTMEMENRLERLRDRMDTPGVEWINGQEYLVVVEECGPYLLGFASEMGELQNRSVQYALFGMISIVIVLLIVTMIVYYSIKRYILRDLTMITEGIERFVSGDRQVEFPQAYSQEMNVLCRNLRLLIETVDNSSSRLTLLVEQLGMKVEVYEYNSELDQCYFSRNAFEMLGVSEAEAAAMAKEAYEAGCEPESVKHLRSGRVVRVHRVRNGATLFGFLYDITEEYEKEHQLRTQLQHAQGESQRDSLTGLYNRKYLEDAVTDYVNKHRDPKGVLISIDMDNFKKINDTEGHLEGDRVLLQLARLLESSFRACDVKARMGGDEFAVFLPGEVSEQALRQKLERLIRDCRICLAEKYETHGLSISVGAVFLDRENADYKMLYQLSDAAMYTAKNNGKDSLQIG